MNIEDVLLIAGLSANFFDSDNDEVKIYKSAKDAVVEFGDQQLKIKWKKHEHGIEEVVIKKDKKRGVGVNNGR